MIGDTMANKTDLIAENKLNIRKNRRKIFELDAEVSTTYAEPVSYTHLTLPTIPLV